MNGEGEPNKRACPRFRCYEVKEVGSMAQIEDTVGKGCCKCGKLAQGHEYRYHAHRGHTSYDRGTLRILEWKGLLNTTDYVCDSCVWKRWRWHVLLCLSTWVGITLPLVLLGKYCDDAGIKLGIGGLIWGLAFFGSIGAPLWFFSPLKSTCGSLVALGANRERLKREGYIGFGAHHIVTK